MDSDLQMPPQETGDGKTAFRKPSGDAANRKYRRRSPVGGSSSDGSPKHGHKGSPSSLSKDLAKASENRSRIKDDIRELDEDYGRGHYGRGADTHRRSDRRSFRSSHGYSKNDDITRHDNRANDGEKSSYRLTSHAGLDFKGSTHFDYSRPHIEYGRSRDSGDRYHHDRYDSSGDRYKEKVPSYEKQKYKDKDLLADRASSGRRHRSSNSEERDQHRRDGRDETRDYCRRSGDYKSDYTVSYKESHEHGIERDRFKEVRKETVSQNPVEEERKIRDDREVNKDRGGHDRAAEEKGESRFTFATENRESSTKKPKLFSPDKATDYDKAMAPEKESSSSKQAHEIDGETQGQAQANVTEADTDLDAAKFAAMKAAELVNRNLVGLGVLSTDQKKKLLWGSKKNTNAEEQPARRWDAPMFGDHERQEKFNKLMGVKGNIKVEHKPDVQEAGGLLQTEKQREVQLDLEKQYTAGLRRRDGRTVGLGL